MRPQNRQSAGGFTLLEILVALAVVSVVMAAAIRTSVITTRNTALLREKLVSHWVVMNEAARLRLADKNVPPGVENGEAVMGGRRWRWQRQTTTTADPQMHRVVISAGPAERQETVSSLIIYLGQ